MYKGICGSLQSYIKQYSRRKSRKLTFHVLLGPEASIDPVVETIPEINVTSGEKGLLRCSYERKPYVVYWIFTNESSSSNLLVALHQYILVGERSGPGYDEGRFNITNDYSLLIHDVSVKDEGKYTCKVADLELNRVFLNHTNVNVLHCWYNVQLLSISMNCEIYWLNGSLSILVICSKEK